MSLWAPLLLLVSISVSAQAPPPPPQLALPRNLLDQDHPAQSKTRLDDDEVQARAWLAKRQKERGQFNKVAEGRYFIKANTDLHKSEKAYVCSDVWTLWKAWNGEFEVDGVFRETDSTNSSEGYSFPYQVKLDSQMRPAAFKRFVRGRVDGCVWTKSKLFCQDTDRRGRVWGAAGAPIDNSTKFLPHFFSPFLFNGLIPNSRIQSGETTYLTLLSLVYFHEAGASIDLFPRYGALSSIRRGTYSMLQANMEGSEFQLDVREMANPENTHPSAPVIPPDSEHKDQYKPLWKFLVSSNGILLSASNSRTQEEFIHLVEFKKLAEF
jgi:hypothetical protein